MCRGYRGVYAGPVSEHTDQQAARNVGRQIRAERSFRGLTQRQLASDSGLSVDTVQRIESGERMAHLDQLFALARALGVDAQEIMRRAQGRVQIEDNGLGYG